MTSLIMNASVGSRQTPSPDTGVIATLFWTIIGVIITGIGIIVTVLLEIRRRRAELSDAKRRVKESLLEEMKNNLNGLKKEKLEMLREGTIRRANPHYISIGAYESCVSSGNFTLLDSSLQSVISDLYSAIKIANIYVEHMSLSTFIGPSDPSRLEALITDHLSNLDKMHKDIMDRSEKAICQLEKMEL